MRKILVAAAALLATSGLAEAQCLPGYVSIGCPPQAGGPLPPQIYAPGAPVALTPPPPFNAAAPDDEVERAWNRISAKNQVSAATSDFENYVRLVLLRHNAG
jgi:hypothetical protein